MYVYSHLDVRFFLLMLLIKQDELKLELNELEQEVLNDRLAGADRAPTTALPSAREEREYFEQVLDCEPY